VSKVFANTKMSSSLSLLPISVGTFRNCPFSVRAGMSWNMVTSEETNGQVVYRDRDKARTVGIDNKVEIISINSRSELIPSNVLHAGPLVVVRR
jgi:hypothetical protein